MPKIIDRVGHIYGLLTVVAPAEKINRLTRWACICACGNTAVVDGGALQSGNTKSCGCQQFVRTHGLSKSRAYYVWRSMHQRCHNPNCKAYGRYGALGINVCERWKSFTAFYEDMGDPPEGKSIDRIDGTKGYSLDNCRWATSIEQSNNIKTNIRYTHNGETMTAAQWGRRLGGSTGTVQTRLQLGWSLENALTTKVSRFKHFMPDGRPAVEVAEENGINRRLFNSRVVAEKWDVVRAATEPPFRKKQ